MNVLSLFDGIACGYQALKDCRVAVDKYYASEIDQNAIAIAKKNHPNIIELGDCNNWRSWNIDFSSIDLLIAGSPCQGFSRNGKMLNFEDSRSKLFFVFVDVLNAIREENPNVYFLLENVEMKKEWEDIISSYLGCTPYKINSRIVSAQSRSRYYWSNIHPFNYQCDIRLKDILEDVDLSNYIKIGDYKIDPDITMKEMSLVTLGDNLRIKQATELGYIIAYDGDGINLSFPSSKTRRGRVIRGKSPTLDCQCNCGVFYNGIIRKFTIHELEALQGLPAGYTQGISLQARKKAIGNGWNVNTINLFFMNFYLYGYTKGGCF